MVAQRQAIENNKQLQLKSIQKKSTNKTGLPDNLKTGMENMTGVDLSDTKVHYNSNKPAQLNAHAYAQGTDIHLGAGQEKHIGHELAHVVQQKQGRVKPTTSMNGVGINDNAGLEKEADVMGVKALQMKTMDNAPLSKGNVASNSIQLMPNQSITIRGSVGAEGDNYISDVKTIQWQLATLGYLGKGECIKSLGENFTSYLPLINGADAKWDGDLSATIHAIMNFQQQNVPGIEPDGLISPTAQTIKALNNFDPNKKHTKKTVGHLGGKPGGVGKGGENLAKDVLRVQQLLVTAGKKGVESEMGQVWTYGHNEQVYEHDIPATIQAIAEFQRDVVGLESPDGLVEAGKGTIESLEETKKQVEKQAKIKAHEEKVKRELCAFNIDTSWVKIKSIFSNLLGIIDHPTKVSSYISNPMKKRYKLKTKD